MKIILTSFNLFWHSMDSAVFLQTLFIGKWKRIDYSFLIQFMVTYSAHLFCLQSLFSIKIFRLCVGSKCSGWMSDSGKQQFRIVFIVNKPSWLTALPLALALFLSFAILLYYYVVAIGFFYLFGNLFFHSLGLLEYYYYLKMSVEG